jgi:hypothetical protein
MPRSTGITVSAVVVTIGSAFTVLSGTLIVLVSVFALNTSCAADAPVNLRYGLAAIASVMQACPTPGPRSSPSGQQTEVDQRVPHENLKLKT